MEWRPIKRTELENELATQLEALSDSEMQFFKSIEVPIKSFPILRDGTEETVFVVAEFKGYVLFYEDVHDSFEIARLNSSGAIEEFVMYQNGIGFLVNELQHIKS
jgi:hypothetical protein